ncbi:MAG: sigma-54-dependent Fis family transcriptional regulator [Deltaproteobacteria bacterium]|nr:sigma-54-dependent Fis family transcriptional regulator [Deltaproteobacteria bacterium]
MVNEVGRKILTTPNLDALYQEITSILQNEFDFHHLSLWIYDPDHQEAILKAKAGAFYAKEIGDRIPTDLGMIGWALQSQQTVLANDVRTEPHFFAHPGLHTQSELSALIQIYGTTIGVLNVESDETNAFSENDRIVIETISDLCALAIYSNKHFLEVKNFNRELERLVSGKTKELQEANEKILQQQELLKQENKSLKTFIHQKVPKFDIIGSSKPLKELLLMVDRIAPTEATVVIQGESGTGKELIAKRLHENSQRTQAPYVTINCGALNENLLISELFGHEKGSFTGAHTQKIGLVETAHGGTLFLDEIAEMGKHMQTKLLRFLQEGEFYRVGGKKALRVNVRVISATNRDLEIEVQEGRFREDLYYRLNTITLRVPPLRKRTEDLESLIFYFLNSAEFGGARTKAITHDALQLLKQYHWPGNIRELQNAIERLKILSDGTTIQPEDILIHLKLPKPAQKPTPLINAITALEEVEKTHILRTLEYFDGNKTKTASALGITIKTLYNKLNRYDTLSTAH